MRRFILRNCRYSFSLFHLQYLVFPLFLSILIHDEKTKPNRKPILTSPDLARSFWEVWLSSSPPRQLLSCLFAFVPLDRPSPPAGSSSCPTDRGRSEPGQRWRRRWLGEGGAKEEPLRAHPAFSFPLAPPAQARGISRALLLRRGRSAALLPSESPDSRLAHGFSGCGSGAALPGKSGGSAWRGRSDRSSMAMRRT